MTPTVETWRPPAAPLRGPWVGPLVGGGGAGWCSERSEAGTQLGQDLGSVWEAQGPASGVAYVPGGGQISSRRNRVRWARPQPRPLSRPASSCSQADRFTARRAPRHPGGVDVGVPGGQVPQWRHRFALRSRSSMSMRPRCQRSRSATYAGGVRRVTSVALPGTGTPERRLWSRRRARAGGALRCRGRAAGRAGCARPLTRRARTMRGCRRGSAR